MAALKCIAVICFVCVCLVSGILQDEAHNNVDFDYILQAVADDLALEFPPGGGFQCK